MISIQPQNVTDTKVTVTSTATLMYTLMDTASSTKNARQYYSDRFANALIINPEDGDIRYLVKGTPTASVGILISSGSKEYIPGVELDEIKLIRVGSSDVAVTVVPYRSEPGESPANVAYDVTLEASSITIGDVQIQGLGGASTNGTDALTPADTWVQVPTSAPASDYVLVVSKENSAGTIRWSFENGGTPSATNGNKLTGDDASFNLQASQVVYFASSTDGDDMNWTTKIL